MIPQKNASLVRLTGVPRVAVVCGVRRRWASAGPKLGELRLVNQTAEFFLGEVDDTTTCRGKFRVNLGKKLQLRRIFPRVLGFSRAIILQKKSFHGKILFFQFCPFSRAIFVPILHTCEKKKDSLCGCGFCARSCRCTDLSWTSKTNGHYPVENSSSLALFCIFFHFFSRAIC